ncbi:unnamed protein product [Soboliphyme baturini]|uniref:Rad21_Rec8 domain-containing protein n=1 Tax=Soboliphyme baturini TaxID=241478 RepID=A0A183J650_9BILA|nr:unnamed protein product [Soboliphyme baturini]
MRPEEDPGFIQKENVAFRTAAGKVLTISEQALEFAEKRFQQEKNFDRITEGRFDFVEEEIPELPVDLAAEFDGVEDYIPCAIPCDSFALELELEEGENEASAKNRPSTSSTAQMSRVPLQELHFKFYNTQQDQEEDSYVTKQMTRVSKRNLLAFLQQTVKKYVESKNLLKRALDVRQESVENPMAILRDPDFLERQDEPISMVGFRTAGGGSISVNPESLENAASLLARSYQSNDEDFLTPETDKMDVQQESIESVIVLPRNPVSGSRRDESTIVSMVGFKTAGGESIRVKQESLEKAAALLTTSHESGEEIFPALEMSSDNQSFAVKHRDLETGIKKEADHSVVASAFDTTSDKAILISKNSVKKVHQSFVAEAAIAKASEVPAEIVHDLSNCDSPRSVRPKFPRGRGTRSPFLPPRKCTKPLMPKSVAAYPVSKTPTSGDHRLLNSFRASPNVDEKLVSYEWLKNHYRWIVWKLSAMEKSFPLHCAGKCLTLNNVMLQLKYRYDREIEHSHRSVIKKILNHDHPAAAPMVLFVADILESDLKDALVTVVLSDGWYQIKGQCDKVLSRLVRSLQITVGMKLFIVGATLYGAEEGCEPLEALNSVRLAICVNGVRRARWYTKLGYQRVKDPSFWVTSLYHDGGMIPSVDVFLLRKYPLLVSNL